MALVFDQEDIVQLVGFRIGAKLFGASILTVREILRAPAIDTMAGAPAFIAGIVRLRGAVIPVIHLGDLLGVPTEENNQITKWVLIGQAGKRTVGFIVDAVTPIVRIKTDTILPPPDLIIAGMRTRYIRGVCETDKGVLMIVELERVFQGNELEAMERIPAR